ncbi:MAG: hypothetical protein U1E89_14650 [Burkholderiaceae bacterium]
MSIERATSAATSAAVAGVSAPRVVARRERDADAPRPVAGKHALLHARRLREREAGPIDSASIDEGSALRLRTGDGAVVLVLRSSPSGLVVERIQRRPLGACFMQSFLFTDREGFDSWCEADAIRFDEPVVYDRLRREGRARLGGER